jgi:hypothetical protein
MDKPELPKMTGRLLDTIIQSFSIKSKELTLLEKFPERSLEEIITHYRSEGIDFNKFPSMEGKLFPSFDGNLVDKVRVHLRQSGRQEMYTIVFPGLNPEDVNRHYLSVHGFDITKQPGYRYPAAFGLTDMDGQTFDRITTLFLEKGRDGSLRELFPNVSPEVFINYHKDRGINLRAFPASTHMRSQRELDIEAFIKLHGIECYHANRGSVQDLPFEIDLYLPTFKIGIEFNGYMYHNCTRGINEDFRAVSKQFHKNKTNECLAKGITLYHIWEDMPDEIVKRFVLYWTGNLGYDSSFETYEFKTLKNGYLVNRDLCPKPESSVLNSRGYSTNGNVIAYKQLWVSNQNSNGISRARCAELGLKGLYFWDEGVYDSTGSVSESLRPLQEPDTEKSLELYTIYNSGWFEFRKQKNLLNIN